MNTASNDNTSDLDTKLETLADGIRATNELLAKFAAGVTSLLSGQQVSPTAGTAVKRRGRPPKPPEVRAEELREKPLHPIEEQFLQRIMKEGRVQVTNLADAADVSRPLAHHHATNLAKRGKITIVERFPNGVRTRVAYAPGKAVIRDQ